MDNRIFNDFNFFEYFFCMQGCDRNSEEKHALSHNKSKTSHSIVVHLQSWVVW